MCNCDDNINSTEIFSGPQGPTGPTGPTPIISGTSVSNLAVGTGSTVLTTQADIVWSLGQRVRITNSAGTKVMEGPITAYSGTTLTVLVDRIIGSGNNSAWNIVICGEVGATGATGAAGPQGPTGVTGTNAFTILNSGIALGANLYNLNVTNSDWMVVGQVIYIENSGYYQVTIIVSVDNITVLDLLYAGNVATFLAGSEVSPGGLAGTNGFIYETVDGNGIAATSTDPYAVLVRNAANTGYEFMSATDYKDYLGTLPATGGTW